LTTFLASLDSKLTEPFGTLKAWMGATHFLTKRLPRVSTEMSLHVLAYNLKRVMRILGISPLMQAMRA
jgi:transposase